MFSGVFTALITPFKKDGTIDWPTLETLVKDQLAGGISGLVPVGTTGESPTLSHEENLQVVEKVIEIAGGKVPIIAGTGSNCTDEAITMTKRAAQAGATASLQVAPYYNKPNQEGLYRHFMTIADQVDLPMVIYNIKGRSGVNIETPTLMKLAKHPHIQAVKEASGDLAQMMDVLDQRPDDFSVLSGDDNLALPLTLMGGNGVISVISNFMPQKMEELVGLALQGKVEEARKIHFELMPLFKGLLSLDTNPVPVKTVMSLMKKTELVFRLPICEPTKEVKQQIKTLIKQLKLI